VVVNPEPVDPSPNDHEYVYGGVPPDAIPVKLMGVDAIAGEGR
jgi:hypothetical protein